MKNQGFQGLPAATKANVNDLKGPVGILADKSSAHLVTLSPPPWVHST
jgi:hypothetical protein